MIYTLTSVTNENIAPEGSNSNQPGAKEPKIVNSSFSIQDDDDLPKPVFTSELDGKAFNDYELFREDYESKIELVIESGAWWKFVAAGTAPQAKDMFRPTNEKQCSYLFHKWFGEPAMGLFAFADYDILPRMRYLQDGFEEAPFLIYSLRYKEGSVFVDVKGPAFTEFFSNKKIRSNSLEFQSIIKGIYKYFIGFKTTRGIISNWATTLFLEIDETKLDELLKSNSIPGDAVIPFRYKVINLDDEDLNTKKCLVAWIYHAFSDVAEASRMKEQKVFEKFHKLVEKERC